jgi:antitoxin (DNA-binding transcriptional repressor) of toxin-antitoxin stability system
MGKKSKSVTPPAPDAGAEMTVTEVARNFSAVVDRVRHGGERFILTKGGISVAELRPPPATRIVTGADLARRLATIPHLGAAAADALGTDIDDAREAAGRVGGDPWG